MNVTSAALARFVRACVAGIIGGENE